MLNIEEVAKLAKKYGLHSGEVKYPDDDLEDLYHFVAEACKLAQEKQK